MLTSEPVKSTKNYFQAVANWSDAALYSKCKVYGFNARVWLRKFAGLLPEVNRRQLYKRRGYVSLYEFARKLAGMSDFTVDKILNVAAKLDDKPALKEQLVAGKEGWSKIETVAYIATKETDEFWAKKVSSLTKNALSVYVQEARKTPRLVPAGGDGEHGFAFSQDANFSKLTFPVSVELEKEIRLFKQKLEKERRQTLAWSEVIKELLSGYKCGLVQSSVQQPEEQSQSSKPSQLSPSPQQPVTRHIPAAVKRSVDEKYHGSCAYPACNRPAEIYHHTRRFALEKQHDPNFIVPLCKPHERIVHSGLINDEENPALWEVISEPDKNNPKFKIDELVKSYRAN